MMRKTVIWLTILCVLPAFAAMAENKDEPKAWTVEEAFEAARGWDYGDDEGPLEAIRAAVLKVQGEPVARNDFANALAALLSEEVTDACKEFVSNQLNLIGGPEQAPALAPLLTEPAYSAMARYALEVIPGPEVDAILVAALEEAEESLRVGIINTMGRRGSAAFAEVIAPLLHAAGPEGEAAALAYGSLPNGELSAIEEALLHTGAEKGAHLYEALFMVAERYINEGRSEEAAYALRQVAAQSAASEAVRIAAIHTLARADSEGVLALTQQLLADESLAFFRAGLGAITTHPNDAIVALGAEVFGDLSEDRQAQFLAALETRGGAATLPVAEAALAESAVPVRTAAIALLGKVGGVDAVEPLLALLSSDERQERRVARAALDNLPGEGVDEQLIALLEKGASDQHENIIQSLVARRSGEALDRIMILSRSASGGVQREAIRALGELLPADDLGDLAGLLWGDLDADMRREAERSLTTAIRRSGEKEGAELLNKMYEGVENEPVQASFLRVMGNLGHETNLPQLYAALQGDDAALEAVALTALSGWPTENPRDELIAYAKATDDTAKRADALEGYVRMLRMAGRQGARHLAAYEEVSELTSEVRVLRGVLAGLGEVRVSGALPVIQRLAENPELAREAAVATERVRSRKYRASASLNSDLAHLSLDGKGDTRWQSGAVQAPGMWFQVDLGETSSLRGLVLDAAGSSNDYPRGYEVYVFDDEADMGDPVATGEPDKPVFEISFEPSAGRYVRIVQTGASDEWFWAIHQIRILAAP